MIERLFDPLGQERGAHIAPVQRAVGAAVAALVGLFRVFDLDHVGAEYGKLIGCERPRQHMGDVDDANPLERAHGQLPQWTPPIVAPLRAERIQKG